MRSAFIEAINKNTLCTWYILPLIGLNKFHFQEGNFIDSFITVDGAYIVVEVADWNLCPSIPTNKTYVRKEVGINCDRLVFKIPENWAEDMSQFLRGAYSKMSEFAKQTIKEGSGLKYEHVDEAGNRRTDAIILALDMHPILREQWIAELSVELHTYRSYPDIPDNMELLSIPQERIFTKIEE
jgi:hypothetical protein